MGEASPRRGAGETRRVEQHPLHRVCIRPGEFDPRRQAVQVQQKRLRLALAPRRPAVRVLCPGAGALGCVPGIGDRLPQEGRHLIYLESCANKTSARFRSDADPPSACDGQKPQPGCGAPRQQVSRS